ncbi:MAG: DUF3108 domain-containing protein [Pseudomonadota bacterium]
MTILTKAFAVFLVVFCAWVVLLMKEAFAIQPLPSVEYPSKKNTRVSIETTHESMNFPAQLLLPYKAEYDGFYNGKKVGTAYRELKKLAENRYELIFSSHAKLLLFEDKRSESIIFQINSSQLMPLKQTIEEKRPFKNKRTGEFSIDWKSGLEKGSFDGRQWEVPHKKPVLEQVSQILQVRADIFHEKPIDTYLITKKGEVKSYDIKIVGSEFIKIGALEYETIKVERMRSNSPRVTEIWLDKNRDFFPIRIRQLKDDKVQADLQLRSLDFLKVTSASTP